MLRWVRVALAALAVQAAVATSAFADDWERHQFGTCPTAHPASNARGDVLVAWIQGCFGAAPVMTATREPDGTYAVQQVGIAHVAESGMLPTVAVDGWGNATVAWTDDLGWHAARHAAGEPFGPAHQYGPVGYQVPDMIATRSHTFMVFEQPGDTPTVRAATWDPADTVPKVATVAAGSHRWDSLRVNSGDDAAFRFGGSDGSNLMLSRDGGGFEALRTPGPAFGVTDGGGLAAAGDLLWYRAPGGEWVEQGPARGHVESLAINGRGEAIGSSWHLGGSDPGGPHLFELVRWRPELSSAQPPESVFTADAQERFDDIGRDAAGGVTALATRPQYFTESEDLPPYRARIVTVASDGSISSKVITTDTDYELNMGSGPRPGQVVMQAPGPVALPGIVWTHDLPPIPAVQPPDVDLGIVGDKRSARKRRVRVRVRCPQSCSVSLKGAGRRRRVELARGGKPRRLTLKLTARQRKTLRRALRRHGRARVHIKATARFASGRRRTARRTVRLRRH